MEKTLLRPPKERLRKDTDGEKMNQKRIVLIAAIVMLFMCQFGFGQYRDHFVFSQLKYRGGSWNLYPSSFAEIINMLITTTSIKPELRRNDIALTDKALFITPFLWMTGDVPFGEFNAEELRILRQYLLCGGLIVIDDASGNRNIGFDKSARDLVKTLFPENKLEKIPEDHAIFRSFYLLREVGGRKIVNRYLEGITIDKRLVLIYSQNNIYSAWARDQLGNWLYECVPGGELQRMEAMKLTVNIIMYSLTGDYKKDLVHKQYIEDKLRLIY